MTHKQRLQTAEERIGEWTARAGDDPRRQQFHFSPPCGWMNDPNGLIYWRGQYHVFYQYNPYGVRWDAMHWGHAVSGDLLSFTHLPPALAPSEPYDDSQGGGCFSGSAAAEGDTLTLVYTGALRGPEGSRQTQCVARSADGVAFEKDPGNPAVLPPPGCAPGDFRDPKVWRHGNHWYMVCAGSLEGRASLLLYGSQDLTRWKYRGVLLQDAPGGERMWECPDLFELDGKYVLILSLMGKAVHGNIYMTGRMDYAAGKFIPEHTGVLDEGFDFYAAQTVVSPEGKRFLMAWQNNWGMDLHGRDPLRNGCLTMPRELSIREGKLYSRPAPQMEKLRGHQRLYPALDLPGNRPFSARTGDGVHVEMELQLDLRQTSAARVHMNICRGEDSASVLMVEADLSEREIRVTRPSFLGVSRARFAFEPEGGLLTLRLFCDTVSAELFVNGGQSIFSAVLDGDTDTGEIQITPMGGGARLACLNLYSLRDAGAAGTPPV